MARQKSAWDKLSMRDRAQFIRLGVQNGIYDIRAIKGVYNEYHDEDSKENHDYNMAAAIATGFGPDQNKHWPDTFKKSNHPTFSVESIYSTKETPGGTWGPNFKTFEPSDWMINTYGSTPTIEYLQKHDPDVTPVYMGGVLLPEITVTANRFNNGGYVGHWKDGTQEEESQELNNTITSQPITMFEQEIPVQPITITDKMRDDYQSQINQNAWDAAENQFNENNLFKTAYDDFKKQFFNIYGELPDTLLNSQQYLDSYVNDGDLMSLEWTLPTMRHHYTKLAANNVDLQNLVNNFNWDYVTTLMNANKDKTDIMSRYKSLIDNTLSGLQYYSDYYNSPGFKERLNHFGQHQLYKNAITPQESILSEVKEISFDPSFNNAHSSFLFGLDYNGKFANYGVGAHEAAHHNTVYNTRLNSNRAYAPEDSTSLYYSPYYKNDYTRIPSSILKILKPSNYTNTHDAEINESYSDLVRTRALLEKLGIYKSTEAGKTFSEEMYDQYLNTEEGKKDRFLQLHDKQQVIDALNLIASNTNTTNPFETSNGTYIAALGGQLNNKKSTGGPLYPFSFEKNPFLKTPAVRYDDGGHLFGFGDWLTNVFNPTATIPTVNTEPAPLDLGELATRQAYAESRFDSNAVSPANAVGLFQVTPNTLAYYNSKTGNAFTTQDLYDDTINQQVRDWYMNDLMNRPWNTKNNPSDSVQYAKSLGAYNWGPTNLVDTLNKAKADGVDIYNSWDWLTYLPAETRDYINFVLRNQNNSSHRNNVMYNRSTDKYKSKVSAIKSKK